MAPLRETALGLKFDSTLTTARTRFGSTLCLAAACAMAASMSTGVAAVPWKLASTILAEADWLDSRPRKSLTSAAAVRAARMAAALPEGTGFHRLVLELQYINFLCGVSDVSARREDLAGTESFT